MLKESVLDFLLSGDVSVTHQVQRDLLGASPDICSALQDRIALEGFGRQLLEAQNPDSSWGRGFYQTKWVSSHYTLLELKALELPQDQGACQRAIGKILNDRVAKDGGLNPHTQIEETDVCVNGMFLQYACYFKTEERRLKSIVDYILSLQLPDGGFNCQLPRSGAIHSSMHSTLSVLEGFYEYDLQGYGYRIDDIRAVMRQAEEFLLMHRLFKSDRTGEVINKAFMTFAYPCRWHYDVLRALSYFAFAKRPYDDRMEDAMDLLMKKRTKDGLWKLGAYYPGNFHFKMEEAGKPSRWNTLRALRVLRSYHRE